MLLFIKAGRELKKTEAEQVSFLVSVLWYTALLETVKFTSHCKTAIFCSQELMKHQPVQQFKSN